MRIELKRAMIMCGKSQRLVAREAGISESKLSTIVRGWIDGTDYERERIAIALGHDPGKLTALFKNAG